MVDLEAVLEAQRTAAAAFKAAALTVSESTWNVPCAPGKWSLAQVVDHVGLCTKVAHDALNEKANMGGLPFFLRPLLNCFFLQPVLKKGFPKESKGPAIFAPARDPMSRGQLCARIDAKVAALEVGARAMVSGGKTRFRHGFFGRVDVADYLMFNALHFDHHREQLPGA